MKWLETGRTGEEIACVYLINHGHTILDRNYRLKYGEIDIVSKKEGVIYFSEVKTVAKEVGYKTSYRPEDNVHAFKIKRLARAVQIYLSKKYPRMEPPWEFFIIAIILDANRKTAEVKVIQDVLTR